MDSSNLGVLPVGGDLPELPNQNIPSDLDEPIDYDDGSGPITEPEEPLPVELEEPE
jgi:hypothetical protein